MYYYLVTSFNVKSFMFGFDLILICKWLYFLNILRKNILVLLSANWKIGKKIKFS